jgi:peptide-methionine (S)-S-oxide reductase
MNTMSDEVYNLIMQKAVFGGGCFWCTEAVFKMLKGVKKVLPGYAGGTEADATYERVSTGTTKHAEVTYIEYNPKEISYKDLLTVFFASHDPTTLNRQDNDIGPQYRSIIFFTTPEQKIEADKFIKELDAVTELLPLEAFYEAEDYHKDYFETHQNAPYCQIIINPKLEKVQKEFANLLKNHE